MTHDATEFDWREYCVLAEELADRADAASRRSAISRAYYAAFHAARIYQERTRQRHFDRHDKHQAVWSAYGEYAATNLEKKISSDGKRLRELRNQADYEDASSIADQSRSALLLSKSLLGNLMKLQPPRRA